ncbi:TPA: hypothetical protein PFE14_003984 [Kluyvera ascorbata]|nr:hypothetical protein [Kluyvera ascorbata]
MAVGKLVLTDLQSDNNSVFTLVSTGNRAITYLHDLDGGRAEHLISHLSYSGKFDIKIGCVERYISLFLGEQEVFKLWGQVIHNGEMFSYGQQQRQLKPLKIGDVVSLEDLTNPENRRDLKVVSLNT